MLSTLLTSSSASPALSLASSAPLLAPVVSLLGWTLVMEAWMYCTRIPAMFKHKVKYDPKTQLKEHFNAQLPASARWVADNYNHLHEQPQVFYATCFALVLLGAGGASSSSVRVAWLYVALRVAHSIYQSLFNHIPTRFFIFLSSSVTLGVLVAQAAKITLLA